MAPSGSHNALYPSQKIGIWAIFKNFFAFFKKELKKTISKFCQIKISITFAIPKTGRSL